uniref:ARAD1C19668p n=1 Tax=Blastobotrys adeninivorans TaxID=409370 RepID=A0A060T6G1_BLAAD
MTRRSLYRQSSRHSAGPVVIDVDEKVSHWSFEWSSPLLPQGQTNAQNQQGRQNSPHPRSTPQTGTTTPGGANADNGDANGSADKASAPVAPQTYPFKVRAWVQVDDASYTPVNDGPEDDVLDIEKFTIKPIVVPEPAPQEGALTAADIRGAVGGDAIPGMSAGQKSEGTEEGKETKEEPNTEAAQETKEEPKQDSNEEPKQDSNEEPKEGSKDEQKEEPKEQPKEDEIAETTESKQESNEPKEAEASATADNDQEMANEKPEADTDAVMENAP